jgi:hypothetical protein
MGQDQAIIVLRKSNNGAELTIGMTLLLAAGKREPEMALLDLLPLEAGIFS